MPLQFVDHGRVNRRSEPKGFANLK
jgi:hypothetical protein